MMTLITGGASCGKSAFAERICTELGGGLVYLAAMKPLGEEGAARVRKHRAQRAGKGFRTVECYEGLDVALASDAIDGATVLMECLGTVVSNELFRIDEGQDEGQEKGQPPVLDPDGVRARVLSFVQALACRCAHVVVVGNEVGCDGVDYGMETRVYEELLGGVACAIAAQSDAVVECVAGVPLVIKRPAVDGRSDEAQILLRLAKETAR